MGYYYLSLQGGNHQLDPRFGWRVGGGRKMENDHATVDLSLATSKNPRLELAGVHARLYFNRNGTLLVQSINFNGYPVVLDGHDFTRDRRAIGTLEARICFGRLAYQFLFTVPPQAKHRYQEDLTNYIQEALQVDPPWPSLLVTPTPLAYSVGDWFIASTVGQGSFGTVTIARHRRSGEVAAAKLLTQNHRSTQSIRDEIDCVKRLPRHVSLSIEDLIGLRMPGLIHYSLICSILWI